MSTDKKITFEDIRKMLMQRYADKPDSFNLSIGHWTDDNGVDMPRLSSIPRFNAYLCLNLGDLRKNDFSE